MEEKPINNETPPPEDTIQTVSPSAQSANVLEIKPKAKFLINPLAAAPLITAVIAGAAIATAATLSNANRYCGSLDECHFAENVILSDEGFSNDYFNALTATSNTMGENVGGQYDFTVATSPGTTSIALTNNYISSIGYDEFVTNYANYINKLDSGTFETDNGGTIMVAEGDVGFACNIAGVENFMVDFTNHAPPRIDHSASIKKGSHKEGVNPAEAGATDQRSREEKAAMLQNTLYLQSVNTCAPENTNLVLPKGVFYFAIGHHRADDQDYTYIIKPRDGVSISGSGIGGYRDAINNAVQNKNAEGIVSVKATGNDATILKPYTDATFYHQAAPDMFYYNEYSEAGMNGQSIISPDDMYISNIHYENFIIDGEEAVGYYYTSAGKGFMYNGFSDMTWNYVVVMNTDGTGFGVDLPMGHSYIDHSLALYNGKKALPGKDDLGEYPGGSGFGIGTGYSNQEKFEIRNSVAYGNGKFGFFYEHQNRFYPEPDNCKNTSKLHGISNNPRCYQSGEVIHDDGSSRNLGYPYAAVTAGYNSDTFDLASYQNQAINSQNTPSIYKSSDAFVVTNSVSANNLFNYGGMRTYDTKFSNSASIIDNECIDVNTGTYYAKKICTKANVYLSKDSRRVTTDNISVDVNFKDINEQKENLAIDTSWYDAAVEWGVANAITYGACENQENDAGGCNPGSEEMPDFGINNGVTRGQILTMVWRMMGYPGYVVTAGDSNQGGY